MSLEKALSTKHGLLFDMDGTLVNTESQTDRAIFEVMSKYGIQEAKLEPARTRGRTWEDIARALRGMYMLPPEVEIALELENYWAMLLATDVPETPGTTSFLSQESKRKKLAVVSSSPVKQIRGVLGTADLLRFFEGCPLVGGDSITSPKPAPDCFLQASAELGVEPQDCLVFEDSSAGLLAAKAANMMSVLVRVCCSELDVCMQLADYSIESFEELLFL